MKLFTSKFFYTFLCLAVLLGCASSEIRNNFESNINEALDRAKMKIENRSPDGFDIKYSNDSSPFPFDYSLHSKTDDFELRYSIHPLDKYIQQHNELSKTPGVVMAPMKEDDYLQDFIVMIMNIMGGAAPNSKPAFFPPAAVKSEFGADWGASISLPVSQNFDIKYKYCTLVMIYKKGTANGYVFYFANDQKVMTKYLADTSLFYNFKFIK